MLQFEHDLHAYITQWEDLNKFSGTVFVAQKNSIVFNKSYGMANHTFNVANTTQTKFHISSISKQFTATAIFLLVQKNLIKLEDSLDLFFPDYPEGKRIKIHHLLTHTCGIPNILELTKELANIAIPLAIDQIIEKFKDKPLVFSPGEGVDYCNSSYILLAVIIEKISGKSFELFLKENIFDPIGMNNTDFLDRRFIIKNLASGYGLAELGFINNPFSLPNDLAGEVDFYATSTKTRLINAPFYTPRNLIGALGLYSTVEDLYLWDRALRNNKILSPELTQQMLKSPKANDGSLMASGWMINDLFGRTCVWHDGAFYDTHTIICRFIEDDVCLIILCNIDWTKSPVEKMAEDIAAMIFGQPYQMPQEQKKAKILTVSEMQEYVGTYRYHYYSFREVLLRIFLDDNKLFLQDGDLTPAQMLPKSNSRFFFKISNAEISFTRKPTKLIDKIIINYGGEMLRNSFEAKKI